MVFSALGPSLAPYVRSSRTLSKWFKPIATWYANLSGYRRVGLVYDDLRASRSPPHQTPRMLPRRLSVPAQVVLSAHILV